MTARDLVTASPSDVHPDISRPDAPARRPAWWQRVGLAGRLGAALILLMIVVAVCAPLLVRYPPNAVVLGATYLPPSPAHWFGTDDLGRDIFARVLYAARVSLLVGVASVAVGGAIGIPLGLVAGYYPRLDGVIMRLIDILLAFPGIILALAIIAALGTGEQNVIIAVGIFSIPGFTRLGRASTLVVRELLYVDAVRALGCSNGRILRATILPNIAGPLIVQATLRIASAIIVSAGLSFLGLGAQPPTPDWGAMVSEGQVSIWTAPWISLFPGLAVFLTVVGVNLLGDALRDVLDPRAARQETTR